MITFWLFLENTGYRLSEYARSKRENELQIHAWIEREFLR